MNTYSYPAERLTSVVTTIIQQQPHPAAWNWLKDHRAPLSTAAFQKAFVLAPRKTGKAIVAITDEQRHTIAGIRPGLSIENYTLDRLCRLWLLLQSDSADPERYVGTIEQLFPAADVNELVALYGALPVLAWPEQWKARCAEGIRSNIGLVLEAVICDNPYPSEYLEDAAWNQLVLKAFFTEKDIDRIIGLDARTNRALAATLIDYAHERRAAARTVPLMLWRCVAPFIDDTNFGDLQQLVRSPHLPEQKAGILACYLSHYPPAKALAEQYPAIVNDIHSGALNWHSLAGESLPLV